MISFGLVSIPSKIYSANQSSESISFNLLHDKCGSRLKQQYICPTDSETVGREAMVKGYEFSRGRYVIFSDEELKAIEEKPTQSIEITEFLPEKAIDPIYYDKPYYLGPDRGGDRAYKLLMRAMQETGRVALAKYAARGKMYLVLLRPIDGGIVMQQLRYANEVRTVEDLELGDVEIKDNELKMAIQLTELSAADEFHPENYRDEVYERMKELVQKKVEGEDISVVPTEEPQAQIVDLMEALKASLAKHRGGPKAVEPAERKPAKRAPAPQTATKQVARGGEAKRSRGGSK